MPRVGNGGVFLWHFRFRVVDNRRVCVGVVVDVVVCIDVDVGSLVVVGGGASRLPWRREKGGSSLG